MIAGEYSDGGYNPRTVSMLIITTTVAVILIQAFQIPVITNMQENTGGIHFGDTYDRTFTSNLDDDEVEWQFTGTAVNYGFVTQVKNHVHIEWGKGMQEKDFQYGDYTLVAIAISHQPEQTAMETLTFTIVPPSQYKQMILLIPTLLIMAIIMFVIRPLRNRNKDYGGGDYGGGDYSTYDIQGNV